MSTQDNRTDERTDGALVLGLRDLGDTMAFEVLIKRYERPLYGFIARQLGNRTHASDVYQQTLLSILDRIDTCTSPESFKPWAFTIASNACRNFRRTQSRAGERSLGEVSAIASRLPDPEQAVAANQTGQRIAEALATLPDVQREVFVLHHYTQLSYEEVAIATSAPLGTVKSRMNAALVHLRGLLAGLGEELS
ncbi:MAG: sigma-70 family RNA polymerase sigma factor [Myxococcales bacterium]|nr:sigma-70 family RNA polymerase sigma factor [Myxococcales bacterium]